MGVSISYDADGRMIFSNLSCSCLLEHATPRQDIYVGQQLIEKVPHFIRQRGLGTRCVLVCDNNTYEIAGRRVEAALRADGFAVTLCRVVREGKMVPDETAVGEVVLSLAPDTEFLVAVGSGSVTDITRVTAKASKLPFVSVGTAPSMDGYTSVVAPLIFRGAKIHRKANCPEIIVCDLDIMSRAPEGMFISGVGDVLGKFIAKADWVLGSIINDEVCCPTCCGMVLDAVNRLLDNIPAIRARTIEGTRILIEALLLAGLTIMIVGHTRAVASVEHNIGHYWDMRMLRKGLPEPTHGTAVGIATRLIWPVFEAFADADPEKFDIEKAKKNLPTREVREKWMRFAYGDAIAEEIMAENPGDFLTEEELVRRVERAKSRFAEIRAELKTLPSFERIDSAMRELGSPLTPAEIGIDADALHTSLRCAKDYRERYTLFKLLDELGELEDYLKRIE